MVRPYCRNSGLCSGLLTSFGGTRQIYSEGRTFAGLAVDPDIAAALLDNAIHGREAQASSLRTLSGKKWLEDVRLRFRVHARTGVADGKHDVFAGRHWSVETRIAFVERGVGSFDGESSALRHGVARIDCEVHDDLLDLAGVGFHRANVGARDHN